MMMVMIWKRMLMMNDEYDDEDADNDDGYDGNQPINWEKFVFAHICFDWTMMCNACKGQPYGSYWLQDR